MTGTASPLLASVQRLVADYRRRLRLRGALRLGTGGVGLTAALWRGHQLGAGWPLLAAAGLVGVGAISVWQWRAGRRERLGAGDAALTLDRALGLQARLVTTLEFADQPDRSSLYPILAEETSAAIQGAGRRLPRLLDRPTTAVGVLAVFCLLLLLVGGPWPVAPKLMQLAAAPLTPPLPPPEPPPPAPQQSGASSVQPQSSQGQQGSASSQSPQPRGSQGSQGAQGSQGSQDSLPHSASSQSQGGQGSQQPQPAQDAPRGQSAQGGQQAQGQPASRQAQTESSAGQQQGQRSPSASAASQPAAGRQPGSASPPRDGQAQGAQQSSAGAQRAQAGSPSTSDTGSANARSGRRPSQQRGDQSGGAEPRAASNAARGASGGGRSLSSASQDQLKSDIQALLKDMSSELKQMQTELQQHANQVPAPGTGTDSQLYDAAAALEATAGRSNVPIQLQVDDQPVSSSRRKAGGTGAPSARAASAAPQQAPQDVQLAQNPSVERGATRAAIPPDYRPVFEHVSPAKKETP